MVQCWLVKKGEKEYIEKSEKYSFQFPLRERKLGIGQVRKEFTEEL